MSTVVSTTAPPANASLTGGALTCAQTSVTLTAGATGGTSYTITNGVNRQANTTGIFVVSQAGNYTATISNAGGCTATATATVTPSPSQAVGITSQPVTGSAVCPGSTVSVPVSVTGTVVGYQWYKGEPSGEPVLVNGQASATLTLSNAGPADTGSYSVVVTSSCNAVTSTAFSLTISPLPANASLTDAVIGCTSATLTASATGGSTYSLTNGTNSQSNTTGLFVVSQLSTYSMTVVNTSGCSATATYVLRDFKTTAAGSIQRLTVDESACPVQLAGRATGTGFVFTNTGGYVFSNVYRTPGTYDVMGVLVKQSGLYTFTVINTSECGNSVPVTRTVMVNRSCP